MASSTGLRFELIEGWEQLPAGWEHADAAAVAVDSRDRVFLLHRGEHPVIIYDRDGRLIGSWGDGLFTGQAHGITIDPGGMVYITDRDHHTVRKFTPDGVLLMTLGTPLSPSDTGATGADFRTIVDAAGPFNCPTNLAIAADGDLYVSDGYANARVHRFSATGELKQSWGGVGAGPGEFNLVHGIAISADGRVFVCDREHDRVQIFSLDGEYLAQWSNVQRPTQIVFDAQGRAYVSELPWPSGATTGLGIVVPETLPGRVSVFDRDGQVIGRLGSADPHATTSVAAPHGLAIDSHGDLYVAQVAATASRQGWIPEGCSTFQKFSVS